jgi:hypothetical protein
MNTPFQAFLQASYTTSALSQVSTSKDMIIVFGVTALITVVMVVVIKVMSR